MLERNQSKAIVTRKCLLCLVLLVHVVFASNNNDEIYKKVTVTNEMKSCFEKPNFVYWVMDTSEIIAYYQARSISPSNYVRYATYDVKFSPLADGTITQTNVTYCGKDGWHLMFFSGEDSDTRLSDNLFVNVFLYLNDGSRFLLSRSRPVLVTHVPSTLLVKPVNETEWKYQYGCMDNSTHTFTQPFALPYEQFTNDDDGHAVCSPQYSHWFSPLLNESNWYTKQVHSSMDSLLSVSTLSQTYPSNSECVLDTLYLRHSFNSTATNVVPLNYLSSLGIWFRNVPSLSIFVNGILIYDSFGKSSNGGEEWIGKWTRLDEHLGYLLYDNKLNNSYNENNIVDSVSVSLPLMYKSQFDIVLMSLNGVFELNQSYYIDPTVSTLSLFNGNYSQTYRVNVTSTDVVHHAYSKAFLQFVNGGRHSIRRICLYCTSDIVNESPSTVSLYATNGDVSTWSSHAIRLMNVTVSSVGFTQQTYDPVGALSQCFSFSNVHSYNFYVFEMKARSGQDFVSTNGFSFISLPPSTSSSSSMIPSYPQDSYFVIPNANDIDIRPVNVPPTVFHFYTDSRLPDGLVFDESNGSLKGTIVNDCDVSVSVMMIGGGKIHTSHVRFVSRYMNCTVEGMDEQIVHGDSLYFNCMVNYTGTLSRQCLNGTLSPLVDACVLSPPSLLNYTLTQDTLVLFISSTPLSLSPSVVGLVTLYSISPSLPDGLSMNSSTGVISGRASVVHSMTLYTVTALNQAGNCTYSFSLAVVYLNCESMGEYGEVESGEDSVVSDSCPLYYEGSTYRSCFNGTFSDVQYDLCVLMSPSNLTYPEIADVLTNNTMELEVFVTSVFAFPLVTGRVDSFSITPSLPPSLSFNTTTGMIQGRLSDLLIPVTQSFLVTAINESGESRFAFDIYSYFGQCESVSVTVPVYLSTETGSALDPITHSLPEDSFESQHTLNCTDYDWMYTGQVVFTCVANYSMQQMTWVAQSSNPVCLKTFIPTTMTPTTVAPTTVTPTTVTPTTVTPTTVTPTTVTPTTVTPTTVTPTTVTPTTVIPTTVTPTTITPTTVTPTTVTPTTVTPTTDIPTPTPLPVSEFPLTTHPPLVPTSSPDDSKLGLIVSLCIVVLLVLCVFFVVSINLFRYGFVVKKTKAEVVYGEVYV